MLGYERSVGESFGANRAPYSSTTPDNAAAINAGMNPFCNDYVRSEM